MRLRYNALPMGMWSRVKRWFGSESVGTSESEPPVDLAPAPPPPAAPPPPPPAPAPAPPSIEPIARDRALEDAIAENLDSDEPYLVYADWLQERGDPRGELIALQVAMRSANGAELATLRDRESALHRDHGTYFHGPLPVSGLTPKLERGFARSIELWDVDSVDELLDALALDHPATRFVTTIYLREDDVAAVADRLREELADRDPPCRIVVATDDGTMLDELERVETAITCKPVDAGIELSASIDNFSFGSQWSYSYLVRTIVTGAVNRTWWYGSGSDLTEESFGDDPPFTGIGYLPAFDGRLEVRVTVRLVLPDDDAEREPARIWLDGRVEVDAGVESCPLVLRRCEPITGTLFDPPPPARELRPAAGRTLVDDTGGAADYANDAGTVLPDVGVYLAATNRILGEAGPIDLPSLAPPGDAFTSGSFGGPRGALALSSSVRRTNRTVLTLVRVPDGAPRHVDFELGAHYGTFSPDGALFAAIQFRPSRVVVYDVDTAREVAAAALELSTDYAPSMTWHDGAVHAAIPLAGTSMRLDVTTGATTTSSIPRPIGYGWRQYGAGAPAYHPAPGRTAWMICTEYPEGNDDLGVTLVGWCDRDGTYGMLAVRDAGWANRTRFGNTRVLEDGRILAIGNQIWIVDPATSSVVDLGVAGNYTQPPVIANGRLYSHGIGPWWTELPARRQLDPRDTA